MNSKEASESVPRKDAPGQGPKPDPGSTSQGGRSGSEDSTRSAGYVADLDATNDRPPGPSIASDPRLMQGAEVGPASRPPPAAAEPRAGSLNATAGAEAAIRSAQERQLRSSEDLAAQMSRSSAGEGPATDRYLDAVESALKSAEEYARSLKRLRDVLLGRLRR